MLDAGFVAGVVGVIAFGWHAVDGLRSGVVRFPTYWVYRDAFEFFREFDPGAYAAVMGMNLVGVAASAWAIAEAVN